MSKYERQYTIQKELKFLVLLAVHDLTKAKIIDDRVTLTEIESRLAENKSLWDAFDTGTPFAQKLSDTLSSIHNSNCKDRSQIIISFADGGWYRKKKFDTELKNVAIELSNSLDFDMEVPVGITEPNYIEFVKKHVEKKTIMVYEDFDRLAEISGIKEQCKIIGSSPEEQAAWLRGILEEDERKHSKK